ncbi:hypothetical protein BsWGS_03025 [Bradybaena similaris]
MRWDATETMIDVDINSGRRLRNANNETDELSTDNYPCGERRVHFIRDPQGELVIGQDETPSSPPLL